MTRAAARPWLAGLDGLRALAVSVVVVFHFAPTVLPGGFLGVDLFFVISGYLITRLLISEIDATGRLSIREFYARRARRLVPAVVTLLLVTATASALLWRDELPTTRGGVLASLAYVTNWWLIGAHQSYFVASGRPPMVQHLWSLAIEEQYYLIWPVLLAGLTGAYLIWRRGDVRRRTVLTGVRVYCVAGVAIVLAVASTLAMALIATHDDVPYGTDSGRVYFGTDTHSMGLLLGAAAGALATRGMPFGRRRVLRGAFLTDLAAAIALFLLVRSMSGVDEFSPGLYRGGFFVASALCVVVVTAVPRRNSALGWLFNRPVLRWLGSRSYSIYLWHWPVAVVTRPDVDLTLPGPQLFLLRTAVTLGLAEASYRLIEQPFRTAGMAGIVRAWGWPRLSRAARARAAPAAAAGILVIAGSVISAFAYTASPPAAASSERLPETPTTKAAAPASPRPAARTARARPGAAGHPTPRSSAAPRASAVPRSSPPPTPQSSPPPVPTVSAFGDSVMLGAAVQLRAAVAHVSVSAIEGRQARDVFADIAQHQAAGTLGAYVVIQTGDNGIIAPGDLAGVLRSLHDRKRVVVLTDRVPRDWQAPNNDLLHAVVAQFRNAVLVDWYVIANPHRDWFYNDGLHVRPPGAQAYAQAVAAALRSG